MRTTRAILVALAILVAWPSSARADATIFLGTNTTPANRLARGASVGFGFLIIGVEFEYSNTSSDDNALAPSLKTITGNLLLQTPVEIFGMQPYFVAGVGGYRERLDVIDHQETNVASNLGGGVKVSLFGPVRLRFDYRVMSLAGGALNSPAHRIYAGLNLKF